MGDDGALPTVTVERAGAVATVLMNRPPANAMTPDFVGAICDAVSELGADDEVRVIVLRSALERIFMAGADMGNMAARVSTTESGSRQVGVLSRRISAIERVPKPTIAAIRGHALGGGCEIALCCDYRLMVDDGRATVGLTETSLGLLPGAGGTQRLPRLIGRGHALRMIIEGSRLKAPQALAVGLVDAALAPEEFDAAVAAKAEQLAGLATRAVGLAKLALLEGLDMTLDEGLARESSAFAEVLGTEDIKEGVTAFLEKRPASFRGR
jgi:enoyl-CoA hydratase/carnithine racemase